MGLYLGRKLSQIKLTDIGNSGSVANFGMNLNCLTFNQDHSGIGVATNKGIRVYSTEPFMNTYTNNEGDIALVEMLYSTTLVAIVPSPRRLRLLNIKRGITIAELTFPSKILALRMNRRFFAVVLEDLIHVYEVQNLRLKCRIETPPNPQALCAISTSGDDNYLVYPCPLQQTALPTTKVPSHVPPGSQEYHHAASQDVGDVRIFNITTGQSVNTIQAHRTAIGCLALNSEGNLLATASEKGTIIRIYPIPDGIGKEPLFEFRRGTLPSRIFHMSFNATSTLLCVSSASETIHIFRLQKPSKPSLPSSPTSPIAPSHSRRLSSASSRERSESPSNEGDPENSYFDESAPSLERKSPTFTQSFVKGLRQTSRDMGMGLAARVGGYLPQSVTQGLEAQRDFAHVKIPRVAPQNSSGPLRSIVAMSPNHPQLMVVTSEGQFGVYNIDLENGGEGVLERQYSVLDKAQLTVYNSDE